MVEQYITSLVLFFETCCLSWSCRYLLFLLVAMLAAEIFLISILIQESVKKRKGRFARMVFQVGLKTKKFVKNNRLLIVVSTLPLLAFIPLPVFPLHYPKDILTTLSQVTASILGIVGAATLLVFELGKKSLGTYASIGLLKLGALKTLFYLHIVSLLISLSSLIILDDPINAFNLRLTYVSIIVFFVSILSLPRLLNMAFSSLHTRNQVKALFRNLLPLDIRVFQTPRRALLFPDYLTNLEENPLFIVTEIGKSALKEGDTMSARYVIAESKDKLIKLLERCGEGHGSGRDVISAFLHIYKSVALEAVRQRDESLLISILDAFSEIHKFTAENKFAWSETIELNEVIEQLLMNSVAEGLNETTISGIYSLEHIMKTHLEKNIPPIDKIWEFYGGTRKVEEGADHDADLQWDNVSSNYTGMLNSVADLAIKHRRTSVVRVALGIFTSIASNTLPMEQLSDKQKDTIIDWSYYYAKTLALKSVDEGLWGSVSAPSPFSPGRINRMLESGRNRPLMDFAEFLIQIAHRKNLGTFILNELGAVGRHTIRYLGRNKIFREAVIFILKTLDGLRELVEQDKTPEGRKLYLETYSQMESLGKWAENHQGRDPIVGEIEKHLAKFGRLGGIEKEEKEHAIEWPKIKNVPWRNYLSGK